MVEVLSIAVRGLLALTLARSVGAALPASGHVHRVVDTEVSWPSVETYRTNVEREDQGGRSRLHGRKTRSAHVPDLVEYRFEVERAGRFALSLSGDELGALSAWVDARKLSPTAATDGQMALGEVSLGAGRHRLQLLVEDVDRPLPALDRVFVRRVGEGTTDALPAQVPVVIPAEHLAASLPAGWFPAISRKIHADFHTAGFLRDVGARFDPGDFVRTLKAAHVNAIAVFAKCHHGYAYYDTAVGTRHPGLKFDLLRAMIEAAHGAGIKVWAYYSVQVDELYASTEPQGRGEGKFGRGVNTDPRGAYVREYLWPMIAEITRYDIDGFFFDFPGRDDFVSDTIRLVRSRKPHIALAYNQLWNRARAAMRELDVMELEVWDHDYYPRIPLIARYAHGAAPLTVMTTRFWQGWGDFGGLTSADHLRWQAATALANGAYLSVGDQINPDGRLDPGVYELIGEAYAFHEAREPWVSEARFVPYVALLGKPGGKPLVEVPATVGAGMALLDAGIHFQPVDDDADLTPFRVVIVPERPVDDGLATRLERHARAGGTVLVVGATSGPLAALAGVRSGGEPAPGFAVPGAPAVAARARQTPLFSYAATVPLVPQGDTRTLAAWRWPANHGTNHTVSHKQSPPGPPAPGLAAATVRPLGVGRVASLAVPAFTVYREQGALALRQLFEGVFEAVVPAADRAVEVEASAAVEVSLMRQSRGAKRSDRLVVHIVHGGQTLRGGDGPHAKREVIDRLPPLVDTRVRIARSLLADRSGRFRQEPEGRPLRAVRRRDHMEVTIPRFHVHTMVVVD